MIGEGIDFVARAASPVACVLTRTRRSRVKQLRSDAPTVGRRGVNLSAPDMREYTHHGRGRPCHVRDLGARARVNA
jgi:hypothetical protein